jgi:hypothetical protein
MESLWRYSTAHNSVCKVIEEQTLWGQIVCRVWLPGKDIVVRLPATRLRSVHEAGVSTVDGIAYLAAAAHKIRENVLQEAPSSLCGITSRSPDPEKRSKTLNSTT